MVMAALRGFPNRGGSACDILSQSSLDIVHAIFGKRVEAQEVLRISPQEGSIDLC